MPTFDNQVQPKAEVLPANTAVTVLAHDDKRDDKDVKISVVEPDVIIKSIASAIPDFHACLKEAFQRKMSGIRNNKKKEVFRHNYETQNVPHLEQDVAKMIEALCAIGFFNDQAQRQARIAVVVSMMQKSFLLCYSIPTICDDLRSSLEKTTAPAAVYLDLLERILKYGEDIRHEYAQRMIFAFSELKERAEFLDVILKNGTLADDLVKAIQHIEKTFSEKVDRDFCIQQLLKEPQMALTLDNFKKRAAEVEKIPLVAHEAVLPLPPAQQVWTSMAGAVNLAPPGKSDDNKAAGEGHAVTASSTLMLAPK